ncbi:MOSC domain-containing protein [Meridianimarinicoccus sp. RP-17]|uniref:MOSC domain-containing protein n=1 Tax=Meridianimarinicoccus zhengii TaxID=2056810 RepID=UPI000DAB5738|nr:MOSC domain-containing protein [Phycocomes zhengii]
MTARLAAIWRHPVKGIGAEALGGAALAPDRPVPGDRAWALLREGVAATGGWQSCSGFLRGANGPSLMAVTARTLPDGLELTHPDRPLLRFDPETEGARLADWVAPLWPDGLPRPAGLVRAPEAGMTDMDYPSVSVLNTASLDALARALDLPALDQRRFRGNLWVEGWDAWAEFDLLGRRIAVGDAVLEIVERNTRCLATHANPDTGERDANILPTLSAQWGHRDFGVYARVVQGGDIAPGVHVTLLP